jgi:DNA repair protein RecN (Recombination protein N)
MDFDEETFYQIEKRLDLINHMKSKYGSSIQVILKVYEEKCERVSVLNDYDAYLAKLSVSLESKEKEVKALCEEISDIRKKNAVVLCEAITQALQDLNFLDLQFTMEFGETVAYSANGYDEPEFMISTNPGEPVKPLGKVASGGELSRIMLAIKNVLSDKDNIQTLIFDEIDTGVSGSAAEKIALKLSEVSKGRQVICVTHLARIAAQADRHMKIMKSVDEDKTFTEIKALDFDGRAAEIARITAGGNITSLQLETAKEMLINAKEKLI